MSTFLIHWLIAALAIIISAFLIPGVTVGFFSAFITAIIIGLLNVTVRPILLFLTLPINILTLGLFTLIINAVIIMIASAIVPGFKVDNFLLAILFAIILSVVNVIFGLYW